MGERSSGTQIAEIRRVKHLSAISLIASNLVVAVIALLQQWGFFSLLMIYWFEAVTIGIYAVCRICVVCWFGEPLGRHIGVANTFTRIVLSIVAVTFFVVKFAGFALGLGFAIAVMPGMLVEDDGTSRFDAIVEALESAGPGLLTAWGSLLLSHGLSFVLNFVIRGEYKHTNAFKLLFLPYVRMSLVMVVLAGGFGALVAVPHLAPTAGFALGAIALKTLVDLISHRFEHRPRLANLGEARSGLHQLRYANATGRPVE